MKEEKRKLTKEEKLVLHQQLAGSANLHTKEGIEEMIEIAKRDDWEDEE